MYTIKCVCVYSLGVYIFVCGGADVRLGMGVSVCVSLLARCFIFNPPHFSHLLLHLILLDPSPSFLLFKMFHLSCFFFPSVFLGLSRKRTRQHGIRSGLQINPLLGSGALSFQAGSSWPPGAGISMGSQELP